MIDYDDAEGDTFPRLYQPPTDADALAAVALAECPAIPFAVVCPPDTNERGTVNGSADPVAYLVQLVTQADDPAIGLFFDRAAAFEMAKAACLNPHAHAKKFPQAFFSDVYLGTQVVEFVGSEPKSVTKITSRDCVTDSPLADPA